MKKEAIIIFVRNPELGKVKTRLAGEIGEVQALQVYKDLLEHTHAVTAVMDFDKFVYYADKIAISDLWENDLFEKRLQEGHHLGDKMRQAFLELFTLGYSKLVIIGSDCPGLKSSILEEAFNKLGSHDVVIGPSPDGGYYLLGLTQLIPGLFENKEWSTPSVRADTTRDIVRSGKQYILLTELGDIDTAADLYRYRQMTKT
ncbi:MAG: TIGR04282 family arsenosugar biosynthesis glycosyltransferase [Ferruginibacter sp.]|nr:TIGR04282 family arsenosugar biosynthesis glycosyltransferase [Chitinophagaceae bacterium]